MTTFETSLSTRGKTSIILPKLVPSGNRDSLYQLEKLLRMTPIIIPNGGMRCSIDEKTGKSIYGFDTTLYTDSIARRQGGRTSFTLVYLLGWSIIVTVHSPTETRSSPIYTSQNLYNLTTEEHNQLLALYERGLNECDLMYMLYRLGNIAETSRDMFDEIRVNTEKRLGRTIEVLIQTLRFPNEQISLAHFSKKTNELPHSSVYGLVSKRVENSWFGDFEGTRNLYFLTELDYSPMDPDASSFVLLSRKAKQYKKPDLLMITIVRRSPNILIECYRLGFLTMNEEYTNAIIDFIKISTQAQLSNLLLEELVLVGGVVPKGKAVRIFTEFFEYVIASINDEELEDRFERARILFTYLCSTTIVAHNMIDIDKRKASHNIFNNLYFLVDQKQMLANTRNDDGGREIFSRAVSVAFGCVRLVMDTPTTRLHPDVLKTFDRFRFFIRINPSDPLNSEHLNVYDDRYMLTDREFVTNEYFAARAGGYIALSLENITDAIVIMPKPRTLVDNEEMERVPEFPSSIYMFYDERGVVKPTNYNTASKKVKDGLTIMDTRTLASILEDAIDVENRDIIERIREVIVGDQLEERFANVEEVTDELINSAKRDIIRKKLETLLIKFNVTDDRHLYINNLDGSALHDLIVFLQGVEEGESKNGTDRAPLLYLWVEKDIHRCQTIDLQEHVSDDERSDYVEMLDQDELKKLLSVLSQYVKLAEELRRSRSFIPRDRENKIVMNDVKQKFGGKKVDILSRLYEAGNLAIENNVIENTKQTILSLNINQLFINLTSYKKALDVIKKTKQIPDKASVSVVENLYGVNSLSSDKIAETIKSFESQRAVDIVAAIDFYKQELIKLRSDKGELPYEEQYKQIKNKLAKSQSAQLMSGLEKLYLNGDIRDDMIQTTISRLTEISRKDLRNCIELLDRHDMKRLVGILLLEHERKRLAKKRNEEGLKETEQAAMSEIFREIDDNITHVLNIPGKNKSLGESAITNLMNKISTLMTKYNTLRRNLKDDSSEDDSSGDSKGPLEIEKLFNAILSLQRDLSDLIWFNIAFENAITEFLGRDLVHDKVGPITSKYGNDKSADIAEKLRLFSDEDKPTSGQILEIYGIHKKAPEIIKYSQDFTNRARVVPDPSLIAKHNPTYFQSSGPCSLLDEKNRPRFGGINLSHEELIVLAHLERNVICQEEFSRLIAVLYHLVAEGSEQETIRSLFQKMINEASIKLYKQLDSKDMKTLSEMRQIPSLEDEIIKLNSLFHHLESAVSEADIIKLMTTIRIKIKNVRETRHI